jgi:DNA-binding winged helix-turn-helix (wHTH) protein
LARTCPHCGQAYEPKSDIRVEMPQIVYADDRRRVSPQVGAVLRELAREPGRTVSRGDLITAMYGQGVFPPRPAAVLKVIVCHARKAIEGWPFYIEAVPRRGYALRKRRTA